MNESTKSNRNDHEVQRRLQILQHDNTGIAKRPLYDGIVSSVIPNWRRRYRTAKEWPEHLSELEVRYDRRIHWPRSVYRYSILKEQTDRFTETAGHTDREYLSGDLEAAIKRLGVQVGMSHVLNTEGKDLNKAAALPAFGKKKDQLEAARQYVEGVLKPDPRLSNCFSVMPGFRTQQSEPDNEKVRLIMQVAITMWMMQLEAFRDTIDRTVVECQVREHEDDFFYHDLPTLFERHVSKISEASCAAVLDSRQYDSTVQECEMRAVGSYLAGDYEFKDLLIDWAVHTSIVMPEQDILTRGGEKSGSITTNIDDGITNDVDIQEAFDRANLGKYITGKKLNGDDIIIYLSTKLDKRTIEKINRYSRRELNPEKSDIRSNTAWFSKKYLDPCLEGACSVGTLVANSLMFKEHETNPVTGSKEYTAIATAQQLSYMEHHPEGAYFADLVRKVDKYPIDTFTDAELSDATDQYLASHSWMLEAGQLEGKTQFIQNLKKGFYARS